MKKALFVGGGRRFDLAKLFNENGFDVIGYEFNANVPISDISTVYTGMLFSDPLAVDDLRRIIEKESVDIVVPLMDSATVLVSKLKDTGLESVVLCSNYNTVINCYNKKLFESFMELNFKELYPSYSGHGSYISKPILGFGSNDINIVEFGDQSPYVLHKSSSTIVQKYIKGREYSVDTYFDKCGTFIDAVPRSRDRISGGEVLSSTIVNYDELVDITRIVGTRLGIIGPANFQFIVDSDNTPYLFEVNCRFGGGFTFSIKAGFDVIKLICNDYFENDYIYEYKSWTPNLHLERSYRDHIFERC